MQERILRKGTLLQKLRATRAILIHQPHKVPGVSLILRNESDLI